MSANPAENVVSRRLLSMRALQTILPSVLEIIDDAPHVALYRFLVDKKEWVRMNVEGSAYITRNAETPFYSLIVLNKKGETDFVLRLQQIEKLRIQENYLMLRCHKNKDPQETEQLIYGIWIHSDSERERIFHSVSGVLSKSAAPNATNFLSKLNNLRIPSSATTPSAPNNNPTISSNQSSQKLLSVLKKNQQNNSANGATSSGSSAAPSNVAEEEKKANHASPAASLSAASALLAAIKPLQNPQPQVISAQSNSTRLRANETASAKLLSVLKGDAIAPKASSANPTAGVASEPQPLQPPQPTVTSVNKGSMLLSALKKERESPTSTSAQRDLCDLLTDAQIASRVKSQQTPLAQPPKPPVSVQTPLTQGGSPSLNARKKEEIMPNLGDAQSPSVANKGERALGDKKNTPQPGPFPAQIQSAQKDKSTLKALLISPSMLEG